MQVQIIKQAIHHYGLLQIWAEEESHRQPSVLFLCYTLECSVSLISTFSSKPQHFSACPTPAEEQEEWNGLESNSLWTCMSLGEKDDDYVLSLSCFPNHDQSQPVLSYAYCLRQMCIKTTLCPKIMIRKSFTICQPSSWMSDSDYINNIIQSKIILTYVLLFKFDSYIVSIRVSNYSRTFVVAIFMHQLS